MEKKKGDNGMFRYADGVDKLFMCFGTLGSIGDGLQVPLMMYVLSDVINEYGSLDSAVSIQTVNKVNVAVNVVCSDQKLFNFLTFLLLLMLQYSLRLLYVAILVGLSAFVGILLMFISAVFSWLHQKIGWVF